MSGLSEWAREATLLAAAGGPAFSLPASEVWLAFLSEEANDSDTGETLPECTYAGYKRTPVIYSGTWEISQWGTYLENKAQITGPTATNAIPVTILGWAWCTLSAGGQMVVSGTIPHGIEVSTSDPTPVIPPGTIKVNLASGV